MGIVAQTTGDFSVPLHYVGIMMLGVGAFVVGAVQLLTRISPAAAAMFSGKKTRDDNRIVGSSERPLILHAVTHSIPPEVEQRLQRIEEERKEERREAQHRYERIMTKMDWANRGIAVLSSRLNHNLGDPPE